MKILLVDDEKEFVSTLAERLSMRGIDSAWASSAQEALDKVEETKFDIAVLDVKMPSMGGIELRRRLQKLAPDMRFIFITGHGSEEDFTVGSEEATSYIIKPMNIETLVSKINEIRGTEH